MTLHEVSISSIYFITSNNPDPNDITRCPHIASRLVLDHATNSGYELQWHTQKLPSQQEKENLLTDCFITRET
jgi:hypothetical protein